MDDLEKVLVVEYIGDRREMAWHMAYLDALEAAEADSGFDIVDLAAMGTHRSDIQPGVDLLVRALRSGEVHSNATRDSLLSLCGRLDVEPGLALGVAPCGDDAESAADYLNEILGLGVSSTPWIKPASSASGIRDAVYEWLTLVVRMRNHVEGHRRRSSEDVLATELPVSESAAATPRQRRFRGIS